MKFNTKKNIKSDIAFIIIFNNKYYNTKYKIFT